MLSKLKDNTKINAFLIYLVGAGICFKINLGNVALIAAFVYTILFTSKDFRRLISVPIGIPLIFFLISVISGLYSKDLEEGIKHINLTILFPLIVTLFLSSNLRSANVGKTLKFFYYSITISTLILLLNAIINYIDSPTWRTITFHEFTRLYDQHPVYFSMNIGFALFIHLTPYRFKFSYKYLMNGSIVILLMGLVLCASKAIISFCIIAFLVAGLKKALEVKQKLKIFIIATIIGLTLYSLPFLKERFVQGLYFSQEVMEFKPTNDFTKKKLFTYDEKEEISDLEIRYIFGKIMLYHFLDDNVWWFGYGQGDVQNYVDYYYFSYNLGPKWYEDYNVHNQYLHTLIAYGLPSLLLLLFYLSYSFYYAIKQKNNLYLFFLLISSFVFFFEVTLVRNKGIIFFYFFNTLFLISSIYFENSNFRHEGRAQLSRRI